MHYIYTGNKSNKEIMYSTMHFVTV